MKKRKLNILIVDDNPGFAERMTSMLFENESVSDVKTASDCNEATDMLLQEPDLVLLDINLPGRNGISLLKQIKASGNMCEVVMISNHTDDYYVQACRKLGARFFLDKTHDFDQIPGIVSALSN